MRTVGLILLYKMGLAPSSHVEFYLKRCIRYREYLGELYEHTPHDNIKKEIADVLFEEE